MIRAQKNSHEMLIIEEKEQNVALVMWTKLQDSKEHSTVNWTYFCSTVRIYIDKHALS